MPAEQIRDLLPEIWQSSFRFAVERHPYEKVLSMAWFRVGRRLGNYETELEAEIQGIIDRREYLNYHLYSSKGKVIVDEVVEYEIWWQRLGEIASGFGTIMPPVAPRAKARFRLNRTPAVQILTDDQKAQIVVDAKSEFDLMNYKS